MDASAFIWNYDALVQSQSSADFWKILYVIVEGGAGVTTIELNRLWIQNALKFDAALGVQKGCVGPLCHESARRKKVAPSTFSKQDDASGKDVTAAICHLALHA